MDVGYITFEKGNFSGSFSRINGKSLEYNHTQNFTEALSGQIPGLTVLTRSGEPGYENNIVMVHGLNSLYVTKPLFVVDGVPIIDVSFKHLGIFSYNKQKIEFDEIKVSKFE